MGQGRSDDCRVEALLAQLSLAEKLSLLSGSTPFWAGMLAIARHDISHQRPWPACAIPRLGLPGLQFVDGPRGIVLRGGATTFPAPISRGASWDPELEERLGAAIAREGRSFGANWFAVVCVNLPRPLLQRLWAPLAGGLAWLTSFGSARPGSAFAAGDRTDLELPDQQQQLIEAVVAANPRTVVVLMGGGAMLCERWRQQVPALVLLGYPGEQGGAALADVLLGKVSPSGRLPFAVPTDPAHLPPFDPTAGQVRYDLWHGYRRLQQQGHAAAFPFGFGLSYSPVSNSDLQVILRPEHKLEVHVQLSNQGSRDTDTVVQVYGEPPRLHIERARRHLIGFQRLHLKAGDTRRAGLLIELRQLAFFDSDGDCWRLEAGVHRVVVARHADDPGLGVNLVLPAFSWANGHAPAATTARA